MLARLDSVQNEARNSQIIFTSWHKLSFVLINGTWFSHLKVISYLTNKWNVSGSVFIIILWFMPSILLNSLESFHCLKKNNVYSGYWISLFFWEMISALDKQKEILCKHKTTTKKLLNRNQIYSLSKECVE